MRSFILPAIAGMLLAPAAKAACRHNNEKTPPKWAASLIRSVAVILDAEVTLEQDATRHQRALIRPLHVYKGPKNATYAMALPRDDGEIITDSYNGFRAKRGKRLFLILDSSPAGYTVSPCATLIAADPAVRDAITRKARRGGH